MSLPPQKPTPIDEPYFDADEPSPPPYWRPKDLALPDNLRTLLAAWKNQAQHERAEQWIRSVLIPGLERLAVMYLFIPKLAAVKEIAREIDQAIAPLALALKKVDGTDIDTMIERRSEDLKCQAAIVSKYTSALAIELDRNLKDMRQRVRSVLAIPLPPGIDRQIERDEICKLAIGYKEVFGRAPGTGEAAPFVVSVMLATKFATEKEYLPSALGLTTIQGGIRAAQQLKDA